MASLPATLTEQVSTPTQTTSRQAVRIFVFLIMLFCFFAEVPVDSASGCDTEATSRVDRVRKRGSFPSSGRTQAVRAVYTEFSCKILDVY